jgi:hypothetical protein
MKIHPLKMDLEDNFVVGSSMWFLPANLCDAMGMNSSSLINGGVRRKMKGCWDGQVSVYLHILEYAEISYLLF